MSLSGCWLECDIFSHWTKSQCLFIWSLHAIHILGPAKANILKKEKKQRARNALRSVNVQCQVL